MIMPHLRYLKYVLRHKWYVLKACRIAGAPLLQGITHDLSKFLPSEWLPYVRQYYGGGDKKKPSLAYEYAWNSHQKRNKHHFQAWCVTRDSGGTEPLPMPERFAREMVADWVGAGLAINGKVDVRSWYEKNAEKMLLHPETRSLVEKLLDVVDPRGEA